MKRIIFLFLVIKFCCVAIIHGTQSNGHHPPPTKHPTATAITPTCPVPSPEMLRCMREWACQYIIRLDLRCLLNLNGNPLLGGLLGGGGNGGGGLLGGGGGSGGGILGNLLGG